MPKTCPTRRRSRPSRPATRRSRSTIARASTCSTNRSTRGRSRGDRTYLQIDSDPGDGARRHHRPGRSLLLHQHRREPARPRPRLPLEPPRGQRPGRQLHHPATGQERPDRPERALRAVLRAQDQRGHHGHRDHAQVSRPRGQEPDPRMVLELQLLRQRGVRHRGGGQRLLQQAGQGSGARRDRRAGGHPAVSRPEPVPVARPTLTAASARCWSPWSRPAI